MKLYSNKDQSDRYRIVRCRTSTPANNFYQVEYKWLFWWRPLCYNSSRKIMAFGTRPQAEEAKWNLIIKREGYVRETYPI